MSTAPPPPPPPRGPPVGGGGGAGGAPHPLSRFASRPAGPQGAAAPTDPAARRANLLSAYSKYASPVGISTAPVATGNGAAPPPPPPTATTATAAAAATTAPPAAGSVMPPPPPRSTTGMGNGYPAPPPRSLSASVGAPPPPSPPPHAALPKMGALDAPLAAPPPPPQPASVGPERGAAAAAGGAGAAATRGPRAGAPGARYAMPPDFATGAGAPAAAAPPPPPLSSHPDAATAPPPPSSAGVNASATQAPAPSRQTTAGAPPPPPLATRVSGAALPRPASSRTSSNGRQSPRAAPDKHADHAAEKPGKPPQTFLAEAEGSDNHYAPSYRHAPAPAAATTSTEAVAHHSRPSSRGSSTHAAAPAAGTRATASLHNPRASIPSAAAPTASTTPHRSMPSFLQPGGGSGGDGPRTPRGCRSMSNSNTAPPAASRGRELLEAALMSRGTRRTTTQQLNSPSVSLSAHPEQTATHSASTTAPPEPQRRHSASAHTGSEEGISGGGAALKATPATALSIPTAAPPPPSHAAPLASAPGSVAGDIASFLGVGSPIAEGQEGYDWSDEANAPATTTTAHPPATPVKGPPRGAAGSISGVESASFTTTGGVQDQRSAFANTTANAFHSNPFATVTTTHVNPFRTVLGRSSGTASTAASPPPPAVVDRDKAAGPPPLLPQHTPYTGSAAASTSSPPVPSVRVPHVSQPQTAAAAATPPPPPPPPPVAPSAHAPALSYLSSIANTHESSSAQQPDAVELAMPLLHKPQLHGTTMSAAAAAQADTGVVGPTPGFTTPRGGRDDDAPRPRGQTAGAAARSALPPAPPVPPHGGAGQCAAPSSLSRGPYAASPYTREEEGKRSAGEESPMPLRPFSFQSLPHPDDSTFADGEDTNDDTVAAGPNCWADEAQETGDMAQPVPPPSPPAAPHAGGHANPFSAPLPPPPPAPATAAHPAAPTLAPETESHTTFSSASNPFLQPEEEEGLLAAPAGAASASQSIHAAPPPPPPPSAGSAPAAAPPSKSCFSFVSAAGSQVIAYDVCALAPPQAMSMRSPNRFISSLEQSSTTAPVTRSAAPPLFAEDDAEMSFVSGAAATSVTSARTPAGSTLVNPFSKMSQGAAAAAAATGAVANGAARSFASGGPSPADSFAGAASRRKGRATGAPAFAIFVGGAMLPPGLPAGRSSDRRRHACIAACFNSPRAQSPVAGGGGGGAPRMSSPSAKAVTAGSSRTASVRTNSLGGTARNNTSPLVRLVSAGAVGDSGSCITFCSVTEALTARGSLVDRKGIRGTERGRRYVRTLVGAALPCALHADAWSADDASSAAAVAEVLEVVQACVPAPLCDVMAVMLKDALPQSADDAFAWRGGGGRRLAELLTAAAQAEARRQASTAVSRSPLSVAVGGNGGSSSDALVLSASPLNSATGMVGAGVKERAAAVRKVEDLLCLGDRVEAVEVALQAHLFAHALLISMMCPTKDLYLRSVQAVMQQELNVESPLAHAYSLFNEMPLPPLVAPPPPLPPKPREGEGEEEAMTASDAAYGALLEQHQQALLRRDRAAMQQSWCRHAAVLLANFTRHSGDGLLQLAMTLQQLQLVVEAHTCLLLLHLTPLGMASPARAGAEALPPLSSLSPEDIEDLMPRPDQRQAMEEIRRHLGVVGGTYNPVQGCRAVFLTPATTLLTQLVQLVRARLDARAPPLPPAAPNTPPVPFHGLPAGQPRSDVSYRMMQVLWLRELGRVKEATQALQALLQRMPPPLAFSLRAPPRTLNELVYLFGSVPVPTSSHEEAMREPLATLCGGRGVGLDPSAPDSPGTTQVPSPATSASGLLQPREAGHPPQHRVEDGSEPTATPPPPLAGQATPSRPTTPEERRGGALQTPPPPAMNPAGPPPPGPPTSAPPSSTASAPAPAPLTREQRAAALQPSARPLAAKLPPPQPQQSTLSSPPPPPSQQQQQQQQQRPPAAAAPPASPAGSKATPPAPSLGAKSKPAAPAARRSRSIDALRNFFFRRGNSEAAAAGDNAAEKKTEEAKPMHLDTEKPPAFDPVTGRWLFAETDEEKRLRELAKAGPPKMAPKTTPATEVAPAPAAAPSPAGPVPAPQPAGSQASSPPGALPRPRPGPGAPAPGRPAPSAGGSGGLPAPRPAGAAPVMAGRGAPPPTVAGRGPARHGGRPQYVDMFNNTN